jgi:hypothetical protein
MKYSNIETAMEKLHYSRQWLGYGFLDDQMLNDQLREFETDTDGSPEHYRFNAFERVLSENTQLDNSIIDHFVELAELDEDQTMAQAALGLLARQKSLTKQQLSRLKDHPAFRSEPLQKIISRGLLLRELDESDLTDDIIQQCVSICDDMVQRKLIDRLDISRGQLELLKNFGANRAIRNLAGVRLRRLPQP